MLDTSIKPPDRWRAAAIPKKDGSKRYLLIPNDELKRRQEEILHYLYSRHLAIHSCVTGFMPGKCTLDTARIHDPKAYVIVTVDVKDFFPSFPVSKVQEALAAQLGQLEADYIVDVATFKGKQRTQLPQGAPTSPYLTNIGMFFADSNISKFAGKLGFSYSRYADDLTFATKAEVPDMEYTRRLIHGVAKILNRQLGLRLSYKKTLVSYINSPRVPRRIVGVTVRKDGHGYDAPIGLRKKARAMVHRLYQDLQSGMSKESLWHRYREAVGTVQYCDYLRSLNTGGNNTADPKIKEDELTFILGVFGKEI